MYTNKWNNKKAFLFQWLQDTAVYLLKNNNDIYRQYQTKLENKMTKQNWKSIPMCLRPKHIGIDYVRS